MPAKASVAICLFMTTPFKKPWRMDTARRVPAAGDGRTGSRLDQGYFFGGGGINCAATGMDLAPFLPTARTAKKRLSVETPVKTLSPADVAKSYTVQRGSVVSRQRISNPARSRSSPAVQPIFAFGVTPPEPSTCTGAAGAAPS